jgi:hypothetical protein
VSLGGVLESAAGTGLAFVAWFLLRRLAGRVTVAMIERAYQNRQKGGGRRSTLPGPPAARP